MNTVVYAGFIAFALATLVLWISAFRDLARSTIFKGRSRTTWFVVIFFGPIAGSIAYFSAKRNVQKYSKPDPSRIERLLKEDR